MAPWPGVLSLEHEIDQLRPVLGDATASALIARERREIFSIDPEMRVCAWGGATLLAAAAGLVLKNNLDTIGPLALAILIGAAAAGCSFAVWIRRARAGPVDDYILLLAALLISADVAFVETQFKLLGAHWHRHLLFLALLHGAIAYLFRSRMVLSLSIVALAGWLGIEKRSLVGGAVPDATIFASRAYACALLLLMWRALDDRLGGKRLPDFLPLFEHSAANLALVAGLVLCSEDATLAAGALATILVAAAVTFWGFRSGRESFVLYAFVYAVIAVDVLIIDMIGTGIEQLVFLVIVASMVGAIAALLAVHARFRRWSR